ncbi:MAG TPA: hypothetical protein VGG72_27430 [Bryobacteraceae bacterium]|jgi:hypothetical protein
MFSELIGKKCLTQGCALQGQLQDKGLAICPECAGELTPVMRTRKDRILMAIAAVLILALVGGTFGYAVMALRLTASETLSWLSGRVTFPDRVTAPESRKPWFYGRIQWNFQGSRPAGAVDTDNLICERRGEEYWFHPRFQSNDGDQIHFELNPQEGYVYTFYKMDSKAIPLYPKDVTDSPAGKQVRVPENENMKLSGGPATETFLIVASKKALPELAELQTGDVPGGKLDELAKNLSADKENNLVMFVQVPHS